jgi:hypothetical protein
MSHKIAWSVFAADASRAREIIVIRHYRGSRLMHKLQIARPIFDVRFGSKAASQINLDTSI